MIKVWILSFCLCAFVLSGCGFEPVYGNHGSAVSGVEDDLSFVDIGIIPNREGQYLRNALMDRFYRSAPQEKRYSLSFTPIVEVIRDLDITTSSDSTRAQLRQSVQFVLTDRNSREKLMTRDIYSVVSYNILASEFSNRVSEDNARLNGLEDLAQQVERHLTLYFKSQNRL